MLQSLMNENSGVFPSLESLSLGPAHVVTVVSDTQTPVSAYHKLSSGGMAFLFESTEGGSRLARYSFVGAEPLFTLVLQNGTAVISSDRAEAAGTVQFADPANLLASIMHQFTHSTADIQADLPFSGGLVGYLGYGATHYFDGIKQQSSDPLHVPDGVFGLFDSIVVFDHQARLMHIVSRRGKAYAQKLLQLLQAPSSLPTLPANILGADLDLFEHCIQNMSRETFLALVDKCKENILNGEIFQIVLSQRFQVPFESNSLDFYRLLQTINPSPYGYMLKLPGFDYVGSSPETFLTCRDRCLTMRAIAGTRPRGSTAEADAALAEELKRNEKELAEHYMLVDLARNDLGRVSAVGSVKVGKLAELTKYAHVMHMTTDVTGVLAEGKTCFDAMRSVFPPGTVSGAPKIRAMQLLSELEPDRRGVYSGFVGYFDFSGNMDGAVAIRSALVKDGYAHVTAGAGIVLDSKPEDEYEETRNKAKSVLKAVCAANAARRVSL